MFSILLNNNERFWYELFVLWTKLCQLIKANQQKKGVVPAEVLPLYSIWIFNLYRPMQGIEAYEDFK